MEKLTTATGKEFSCDYFNPCQPTGQCNLRIVNEHGKAHNRNRQGIFL
nr:MAG TPA: hypothetical protein [Caudoviricetes sp.]